MCPFRPLGRCKAPPGLPGGQSLAPGTRCQRDFRSRSSGTTSMAPRRAWARPGKEYARLAPDPTDRVSLRRAREDNGEDVMAGPVSHGVETSLETPDTFPKLMLKHARERGDRPA